MLAFGVASPSQGGGTDTPKFVEVQVQDGAVGTPSISFSTDTNLGLYRIAADRLGMASGGILAVEISAAQVLITYGGMRSLLPAATANNQSVNPADSTALDITTATTKTYTGIVSTIRLPGVVAGATTDTGAITISGLDLSQRALTNPGAATAVAITARIFNISGAAGVANFTGIYTWEGGLITMPNQAANGAANAARGIRILLGTSNGTAGAFQTGLHIEGGTQTAGTQRGIYFNMAAATHRAIDIAQGVVVFAAGAVTAPSLAFTGDLDTGAFSPGADRIGIATAGVKRGEIALNGDWLLGDGTALVATNMGSGHTPLVQIGSGSEPGVEILGSRTADTGLGTIFWTNKGGAANVAVASIGVSRSGANDAGKIDIATKATGSTITTRISISSAGLFTIWDGGDFALGTTTGTKIGTATTQKLGFYNATPIVQGLAVTDASGGTTIDAEARTAINALLARIRSLGLIAT